MPKKITDLGLTEISGVDKPAHGRPGFAIVKAAEAALEEVISMPEADTQPDVQADTVTVSKAEYEASQATITSLQKAVEAMTLQADLSKAETRAEAWQGLPGLRPSDVAPHLRQIRNDAPSAAEWLEKTLDRLATAFDAAGVTSQRGRTVPATDGTPGHTITKLADELVTKGEVPTRAQAVVTVLERNPQLSAEYFDEQRQLAGVS